ncbi:MAG: hypothetical protein JTJ13_03945 [Limosilactobacillus fermentum]|uniref:hypothetical protein n=1 Tax=Limosilactobacillus fermentum TaxID=1613 RepID=UPI0021A386FA|nr:hypothetical protein [Limosilactobacillus fermentum]MBN2933600.1 hypothetical protein [Limosilactobacillus fermentum]
MESIEAIIQQQQLAGKLFGGFFGLEVEQHRVLINIGRNPVTLVLGWIGFYLRPLGRFFISLYF